MKRIFLIAILTCAISQVRALTDIDWNARLAHSVAATSRVMIHDVVNPPAAARYYAYFMLGPWCLAASQHSEIPQPAAILRKAPEQPVTKANWKLVSLFAVLKTGHAMLPSGFMLEPDIEELEKWSGEQGFAVDEIELAKSEADRLVKDVLAYAKGDRYNQLSARLRYTPKKGDGYWYPTPPAYIDAVEPNWFTVRPMVIDTCTQFRPDPCVPFSKDSSSVFFKMAREVYEVSKAATAEQLAIAGFWDCNPFAVTTAGHMMIGFKKISPGGHWMAIAGIVCQQAHLSFEKTVAVHAVLGTTLMDAFISCWQEKYNSNRIRPETVINRYIDPQWQPLLQTPPFPEYTSGHSVISAASAEVLTYFFGDNFHYSDSSEQQFGLPTRNFTSFRQAAAEAAISRLYGGIHYRDAIDLGVAQGRRIGQYIVSKLKSSP
ncbi:MAG: vanadium-dependent haloperoxidase [Chitinophagaceae bacterium]